MKELFYFTGSDLIILVVKDENDNNNSLHYFSHRKISSEEMEAVERYIRNNFLGLEKIHYSGKKAELEKDLQEVRKKKQNKIPKSKNPNKHKDLKAEKAVKVLIAKSMTNYYFEKIGDLIIGTGRRSTGFFNQFHPDEFNPVVDFRQFYPGQLQRRFASSLFKSSFS